MLVTSTLVSPNLSAMSHTGTLAPMKLPEWITGRSWVAAAMPNGSMSSAWACTTAIDVRPRLVDRRMDEALEIERALLVPHRLAVEAELDDVVLLDQLGRERARDEEALRIVGMADADVAVGVDHVLLGEDAVGDDEVLDDVSILVMMEIPGKSEDVEGGLVRRYSRP